MLERLAEIFLLSLRCPRQRRGADALRAEAIHNFSALSINKYHFIGML